MTISVYTLEMFIEIIKIKDEVAYCCIYKSTDIVSLTTRYGLYIIHLCKGTFQIISLCERL